MVIAPGLYHPDRPYLEPHPQPSNPGQAARLSLQRRLDRGARILRIYWTYHSPARKGTLPLSNWKAKSPTPAQAEVQQQVVKAIESQLADYEGMRRLQEQAEKTMRRIVRGLFGLSDGGLEL